MEGLAAKLVAMLDPPLAALTLVGGWVAWLVYGKKPSTPAKPSTTLADVVQSQKAGTEKIVGAMDKIAERVDKIEVNTHDLPEMKRELRSVRETQLKKGGD